jgi:hypothetical protein
MVYGKSGNHRDMCSVGCGCSNDYYQYDEGQKERQILLWLRMFRLLHERFLPPKKVISEETQGAWSCASFFFSLEENNG